MFGQFDPTVCNQFLSNLARDAPGANEDALNILLDMKTRLSKMDTKDAKDCSRKVNDELMRRKMDLMDQNDKKFLGKFKVG